MFQSFFYALCFVTLFGIFAPIDYAQHPYYKGEIELAKNVDEIYGTIDSYVKDTLHANVIDDNENQYTFICEKTTDHCKPLTIECILQIYDGGYRYDIHYWATVEDENMLLAKEEAAGEASEILDAILTLNMQ